MGSQKVGESESLHRRDKELRCWEVRKLASPDGKSESLRRRVEISVFVDNVKSARGIRANPRWLSEGETIVWLSENDRLHGKGGSKGEMHPISFQSSEMMWRGMCLVGTIKEVGNEASPKAIYGSPNREGVSVSRTSLEEGHDKCPRVEIQDESENLALFDVPIIPGPSQPISRNWVEFGPSADLNPIGSSLVQVISHESRLQEIQVEIDDVVAHLENGLEYPGSEVPRVSKGGAKPLNQTDKALRQKEREERL
ncbi:hypothetical protein V6N13_138336 [Hibiscus sabdariffa]